MGPSDYVKNAVKTESNDFKKISERLSKEDNIRLLHAAMGLETEVGEFMDPLKKFFYYGKELDKVNLAEEVGDMMWYIAIACDTLNVDLGKIMETNIKKLQARYPSKFTEEDAVERDLKTERKILEE